MALFRSILKRARPSQMRQINAFHHKLPISLQIRWWLFAERFKDKSDARVSIAIDTALAEPWSEAILGALNRNARSGCSPGNMKELAAAVGLSPGHAGRKANRGRSSVRDAYRVSAALAIPVRELLPLDWQSWLARSTALLCGEMICTESIELYVNYWAGKPASPRRELDPALLKRLAESNGRGIETVENNLEKCGHQIDVGLRISKRERSRLDRLLRIGEIE